MPFSRTKDFWYADPRRRIAPDELDRLRQTAERAELVQAVAAIEVLRSRLLASRSPAAREVIAGLTGALRAISRYAGESGPRQEPTRPCDVLHGAEAQVSGVDR
jgi:hypothetical protein